MPSLRGAFFGTSEFAVPALHAFARATACELVVTQPDRPAKRGQKLQPTPVKAAARELGIATLEPEKLRDVRDELARGEFDVFAVASYGKIVPQSILDLPRLGALNVHPSLLPLYRGATPLQSQLRDGVVRGGVTIIAMDAGMDTGDIVLQERSDIGASETYGELHDRYAALGATMLERACGLVARGEAARTPQAGLASDAEIARTLTRPLSKDDLQLDWHASSQRIADFVRSLSPQPLARAHLVEPNTKIVRIRILDRADADAAGIASLEAGAVGLRYRGKPAVVVRTADGAVLVERLVPPNRKELDGAAFAQSLATTGGVR